MVGCMPQTVTLSVNQYKRIESPIAITADPLFVFIIIGAFTTVISFQAGIHVQYVPTQF